MGVSRGKNNGVSGILSVLVDGVGTNPTFAVFVKSHSSAIAFRTKSRRGRTSAGLPLVRITGQDGTGTVAGKLPLTGWPAPDHPEFCTGTLTIVMQTAIAAGAPPTAVDKVDIPVRITNLAFSLAEPDPEEGIGEDLWDVTAAWTMIGAPVWTWQGTRVTVSAPAATDQELYEGLQKIYDVNGLLTGAIQHIDCDQIADTDDAEATKLIAIVAAATSPPLPNLKVVNAAWTRPGEDGFGGEIVITWGLQDSKDEIETPANVWTQDPNNLRDQRTLAQVWASGGSPPTTPTPPSGLKIVTFRDDKRNDQFSVRFWTFGRTDTKDDIEFPQTTISVDPAGIRSGASAAALSASDYPSIPSNLVVVATDYRKINDGSIVTIQRYGTQTSDEEIANKSSSSERSAIQAWTDVECSVIASTLSASDLADAQWAAYQANTNLLKLTTEKIDPNTARVIYFYYNPGIMVQGMTRGAGRLVRALNNSGTAQVYVAVNKSRGSSTRLIQLSEQWITSVPLRQFIVWRTIMSATIPEVLGALGMTNNAAFLGLDPGTCCYEGPIYSRNISFGGVGMNNIGYQISSDANGFFDGPPDNFFGVPLVLTTSTTSTGWVNASDLGLDDFIDLPTQGDFSPIVS